MNKTNINKLYKEVTGRDANITDLPQSWYTHKDILFRIECDAPDIARVGLLSFLKGGDATDASELWEWMQDIWSNYEVHNFTEELQANKEEYFKWWMEVVKQRELCDV